MKFYETKNSKMIINLDEILYLKFCSGGQIYEYSDGRTHTSSPHGLICFKGQETLGIETELYYELKKILLENKGVKINE